MNQDTMEEQNDLKEEKKPQFNVDMILLKEIGQFGFYQIRVIFLAGIAAAFLAMSINQFMFTAARINTRCFIPQCDDPQPSFSTPWLTNAIPAVGDSIDNCNKFAPANSSIFRDVCPKELFDRNNIIPCEEFVYANTDSVVYEFDLACNEWLRSLIGTLRTAGTLFALPISGYISDRWGRRTCMVLNICTGAFVGCLRVLANTYVGFVISQFFEGFSFGVLSCAYIMSMEVVGTKFRVAAAACISSSFAVGNITLAAIAWGVPYWRHLSLLIYIPQFLIVSYLWILPENARWHFSKGNVNEAIKIFENAAKVNKRVFSEESKTALKLIAQDQKFKSIQQTGSQPEPWLVSLVFKHKPILLRCIASPIWWISTMCVYHGLLINAVHLVGNSYQNFMVVSAVEFPGFWLAVILMNTVGRKPTLIGGFWVCAACMIAYVFVSEDLYALSLALYLMSRCSISTVMVSIHLYTAELYPTKYRHSLFAFSSMMGRLGHILAPLTPALSTEVWTELPFVMFGALALISGALVFLTPETVGIPLPDTMEQAVNIGKKRNITNKI